MAIFCGLYQKLKFNFQRIHEWWQVKSPAEKWDLIYNIGKVAGDLIGVHLFRDVRIFWYSGSCALMIATFFILVLYTVQYYLLRGDYIRGMECTYLTGVVIGVRQ